MALGRGDAPGTPDGYAVPCRSLSAIAFGPVDAPTPLKPSLHLGPSLPAMEFGPVERPDALETFAAPPSIAVSDHLAPNAGEDRRNAGIRGR